MVPTPAPSSLAPDLDRVWGLGEAVRGEWGGEGKGEGQSGWKGGANERERLVGSERYRIAVFSELPRAVVLIEQGKSILAFKV